jgi:hypothetical protein
MPELTLEALQRQLAAHRLRHLAMDRAYERAQPKQRQRKKNKGTATVAVGEKSEDI